MDIVDPFKALNARDRAFFARSEVDLTMFFTDSCSFAKVAESSAGDDVDCALDSTFCFFDFFLGGEDSTAFKEDVVCFDGEGFDCSVGSAVEESLLFFFRDAEGFNSVSRAVSVFFPAFLETEDSLGASVDDSFVVDAASRFFACLALNFSRFNFLLAC